MMMMQITRKCVTPMEWCVIIITINALPLPRTMIKIMMTNTRKGVTPVEWCNCKQYEIGLKPRRVPVIITISVIIINKKIMIIIMLRLVSLAKEGTTRGHQGRSIWNTWLASKLS